MQRRNRGDDAGIAGGVGGHDAGGFGSHDAEGFGFEDQHMDKPSWRVLMQLIMHTSYVTDAHPQLCN